MILDESQRKETARHKGGREGELTRTKTEQVEEEEGFGGS
jgi:hypothetical protein